MSQARKLRARSRFRRALYSTRVRTQLAHGRVRRPRQAAARELLSLGLSGPSHLFKDAAVTSVKYPGVGSVTCPVAPVSFLLTSQSVGIREVKGKLQGSVILISHKSCYKEFQRRMLNSKAQTSVLLAGFNC